MSQRTSITAVESALGDNWDARTDLQQWINMASVTTDRAQTDAINKGRTLLDTELEFIERILACHYYTKYDPLYTSKSAGGASGSFVAGKEAERYKDMAINMDWSGALAAILNRQTAIGFSLSMCPSIQFGLDPP
jgi:hypothetical protein